MKNRLRYCLAIIVLFISFVNQSGSLKAQDTQGTEFWLSFMKNGLRDCGGGGSQYENLTVIVGAKRATSGVIINPRTNWSTTFEVNGYGAKTINIPKEQCYNDQEEGVEDKGLKIISLDTISLYFGNEVENSYDASNVLPTPTLGCNHIVQAFQPTFEISSDCSVNLRSAFLIVATKDNTVVDITPTVETSGGHQAGQTYSVTLQAGQSYHAMSKSSGANGDLSGTTICSRDGRAIAVFNGNTLTSVPSSFDENPNHIFEQAMPVEYWGREFVVTTTESTPTCSVYSDFIKVTASQDDTKLYKNQNSSPLATLNSGESYVFEMKNGHEPSCYLESDKPVAVFLYQVSSSYQGMTYGSPSMVWISPIEQTIKDVIFSTLQVQEINTHYVNIVCYSGFQQSMTLDGTNISDKFNTLSGNDLYSYAKVPLQHGAHVLRCNYGFNAHVYGIGKGEGYAYTVGTKLFDLNYIMYINDIVANPSTQTQGCVGNDFSFMGTANCYFDHIHWDFGDGSQATSANNQTITHQYNAEGHYNVTMSIVNPLRSDTLFLHSSIYIDDPSAPPIFDSACRGDFYNKYGFSFIADSDTIATKTVETIYGCDSIVTLNLSVIENEPVESYLEGCDAVAYNGAQYTESCRIPYSDISVLNGCDSTGFMNITVNHSVNSYDTAVACNSYKWRGMIYEEIGLHNYIDITKTPEGCDSIFHLNLDLKETSEHIDNIAGLETVFVASNVISGRYRYTTNLSTTSGSICADSIKWEINNDDWILEVDPNDRSQCILTVTTRASVVLRVSYPTASCGEIFKEKNITSGFYDVEENIAEKVSVHPNPASSYFIVNAFDIKKIIIYSTTGQKMLEKDINGDDTATFNTDMLKSGIYILKITCGDYIITKEISVIR